MTEFNPGTVYRVTREVTKKGDCHKAQTTVVDELGYYSSEETAESTITKDEVSYRSSMNLTGYHVRKYPALVSKNRTFFLATDQKYLSGVSTKHE